MNPLALGLLAVGGGVTLFKALSKPKASDFQTQQVPGPGGIPVKIITKIPSAVTPAQRSASPIKPPSAAPAQIAVPQTVSSPLRAPRTTYAPPAAITESAPGKFEPAPVIATPSGASSVAISQVVDVQRALNTLGFTPRLAEDGKLGPRTSANIRAFQSKNGLVVDGNAGPGTKAALSSALVALTTAHPAARAASTAASIRPAPSKPAYSAASQTELGPYDTAPNRAGLSSDMTPAAIQHALNLLGASPRLAEDGKLGPRSIAAIKSFQLSHGLVADGVAGPKTKAALQAAAAQPVAVHGSWG